MKLLITLSLSALLIGCASAPKDYVHTPDRVPPEVAQKLREIGRVSAPEPTRPLYAPLQPREPFAGVTITRDLKYGPAERNRLDVFAPHAPVGRLPVLLFMHGGAYVGGDKTLPGSPFYTNVGAWAARNGMLGVNMTYRLAPQAQWPAAQEDIAAAVRWVRANAARYGGDPSRIFLMGHSAGASHSANYVAQPQFHAPDGPGIAGAILVSAYYDLPRLQSIGTLPQYHGADRSKWAERSPLPGLLRTRVPVLFAVAQYDTPDFNRQADILKEAFCAAGRCPSILMLTNHSHMSEIYSVNTSDTGLTDAVLAFIRAR
jgi:triacylglycerol lipase